MFLRLLLLFTLVPLIELYLLLVLGRAFGVLATVALVVVTGFLGAWLARQQGLRTWGRVRRDLASGRLPADALVDALLLLVAGAVLLTPGLLTDLLGFALLVPRVRLAVARSIRRRLGIRLRDAEPGGTVIDL